MCESVHVLVLEQCHWYQSILHPLRDILCAGKMRLHHLPTDTVVARAGEGVSAVTLEVVAKNGKRKAVF